MIYIIYTYVSITHIHTYTHKQAYISVGVRGGKGVCARGAGGPVNFWDSFAKVCERENARDRARRERERVCVSVCVRVCAFRV